jgi:hypothetical protein
MVLYSATMLLGGREVLVLPVVQIGPDARPPCIDDRKRYSSDVDALVDPVGRVGDPGHHHRRTVGVAEAVLDGQAVVGVGVVGGPDLVGQAHDAQVHSAAAAGAGLDLQLG